MDTIKSIEIKNFQSHKNTEIEFHPGVNVIVGRSDSGKSAIMRALYWAFFNRPVGSGYISNWGGSTVVSVDFDDGPLTRVREGDFNGYILGLHDEYKGFAHNIPEPVSDFINMTSINFQHQMDSPFMLSWPAGQRGSFINDTVNLEVMDKTVANIKRIINNDAKKIEANESNIEHMEKLLSDFEDLEEIEDLVDDLEKKLDRLERLKEKHSNLINLIDDIEDVEIFIECQEDKLKAQRLIQGLDKVLERYISLKEEEESLSDLLHSLDSMEIQIQRWSKDMRQSEKEFQELMPDTCPLCGE